jgi:hypothetical protein
MPVVAQEPREDAVRNIQGGDSVDGIQVVVTGFGVCIVQLPFNALDHLVTLHRCGNQSIGYNSPLGTSQLTHHSR